MELLPLDSPCKYDEALTCYLYFINKLMDFCDTGFFILRKSFKQVSFLHVYHHITMSAASYLFIRTYGCGGHASMFGILNGPVHIVMYSYYLLTALRPNMKNSLWWKKYITILQLVQFALGIIHHAWPLFFRPNCQFPHIWLYFIIFNGFVFIYLFSKFYINAYIKKKKH